MEQQYEQLSKLYYNPTTGFTDVNTLIERAKEEKLTLTQKQIKNGINNKN